MDTKKEIVLKILEKLTLSWPLARWIIVLINSSDFNDSMIDWILLIMKDSMNDINENKSIINMQKSMELLNKMKDKEKIDREKDLDEIEKLF